MKIYKKFFSLSNNKISLIFFIESDFYIEKSIIFLIKKTKLRLIFSILIRNDYFIMNIFIIFEHIALISKNIENIR